MSSQRTNLNINKEALSNPSAVDYAKDQAESNFVKGRNEGAKHPFGNNETRWPQHESTGPEGGQYKLPESCNVHQPNHVSAYNRSKVQRDLNQVVGKDNPGVGEYDMQHLKTIANKEFQGGASNNFILFTRQNYQ